MKTFTPDWHLVAGLGKVDGARWRVTEPHPGTARPHMLEVVVLGVEFTYHLAAVPTEDELRGIVSGIIYGVHHLGEMTDREFRGAVARIRGAHAPSRRCPVPRGRVLGFPSPDDTPPRGAA